MAATPLQPRLHQQSAIAGTLAALKSHDRARVVMACGTGKTLTQLWTAQDLNPSRVLVLVPTLALVKQAHDEWEQNCRWDTPLKSVFVCSDKTIGAGAGAGGLPSSTDEDETTLEEIGLSGLSTTDPREINDQIDALRGAPGAPVVVFSTYASADMLGQAMKLRSPGDRSFDVGIFDEAHKTAGAEGKQNAYALSDANLDIEKRVFYTATPRVIVQRRKRNEDDDQVVSMDNESIYGPLAHELSFAAAVAQGLIVDYKIVISVIDDNQVEEDDKFKRRDLGQRTVGAGGLNIDSRALANQVVVNRTMRDFNLDKAILFHSSVAEAESHERFARDYRALVGKDASDAIHDAINETRALSISGRQKMSDRKAIMEEFKGPGRSTISNAKCLTEGVDVPSVDLVAFMDPKKSVVDIVQAVGRAMRKSSTGGKAKECGYILLPLHVAKGEKLEHVLDSQGFQKITDVLSALVANDSSFRDLLQSAMIKRGRAGSKKDDESDGGLFEGPDSKIIIEPGERLFPDSIPYDVFVQSLKTRCMDLVGDGWDVKFGQYVVFKEEQGRWPSVMSKVETEKRLAKWADKNRTASNNGTLPDERKKLLNDICFLWNLREYAWQSNYKEYTEFWKEHNRWPNKKAKDESEKRLGEWAGNGRKSQKRGTLPMEYKKLLDDIGFQWETYEDTWHSTYEEYAEFWREHNRWPSARAKDESEKRLGVWGVNRRMNKKHGTLSGEHKKLLDEIGFVWNVLKEAWPINIDECVEFKKKHGRWPSTNAKDEAEKRLGRWVNNQRTDARTGVLSVERKKFLEDVGILTKTHQELVVSKVQELTGIVGLKTALEFDVESGSTGNDEAATDVQRETMRG